MKEATMKTMMAALLVALPLAAQDVDPRREQVRSKLATQKITLDFKDVALREAVDFVRDFTETNIVIDPKCAAEDVRISLAVKDLSLKTALKLMLASKGLTMTYRDGVLVVVPESEIRKQVYVEMYDVRDLLLRIEDFPGPRVELNNSTQNGVALPGAVFDLTGETPDPIGPEFLLEMIEANTGGDSWKENENVSISIVNGILTVSQSKSAHAEIKRLINLLRQYK